MIFFLTIGYVRTHSPEILTWQGDFVVTTNAGRAVYIVYSLMTIPIITILVSLLSEGLLSTLQKKAELIGVRVKEDERDVKQDKIRREKGPRWRRYTRKLFPRKLNVVKKEEAVTEGEVEDLESQAPEVPEDEVLKDEIEGEVENLEQKVTRKVDTEMGINDTEASMIEEEIVSEDIDVDQRPRRRNGARIEQENHELGNEDIMPDQDGS